MASEVGRQVTWHYVMWDLGSFRYEAQRLTCGGNGDRDCVLGRMGLQQEVLLARQLHEYPARPSSDTEGNFAWVNKTGVGRVA